MATCRWCNEVLGFEKHVCRKTKSGISRRQKNLSLAQMSEDVTTATELLEQGKAADDLLKYGTGVVLEKEDGTVRHVPLGSLTPQQRWRQKNADHVRAKQREYQKAYRARKKAQDG